MSKMKEPNRSLLLALALFKKQIICVLLLLLFFIRNNAVAETPLFRNVPWGTRYTEACDIMKETELTITKRAIKNLQIREYMGVISSDSKALSEYDLGFVANCDKPDISVAGHDIYYMEAAFAYVPNEKGEFTFTSEDSVLIEGYYWFEPCKDQIELSFLFNELEEKISGLYGSPSQKFSNTYIPFNPEKDYVIWEVEDVTIVLLKYHMDGWEENNNVYLSYGWNKADEYLQEADRIRRTIDPIKENVDGL